MVKTYSRIATWYLPLVVMAGCLILGTLVLDTCLLSLHLSARGVNEFVEGKEVPIVIAVLLGTTALRSKRRLGTFLACVVVSVTLFLIAYPVNSFSGRADFIPLFRAASELKRMVCEMAILVFWMVIGSLFYDRQLSEDSSSDFEPSPIGKIPTIPI